jgi:aldehyde dehydrogenase (NAD+)
MSTFDFSKDKLPKQLIINNEYVDSKNSKKLTVKNPKDGSVIADDVPLAGEADVDAAVAAAEKAFPAWRATTPTKRRDLLNKLADLIDKHAKQLGELTRITLGAPWGSFGAFEISLCSDTLRYNAGWTDKFAGETYPQEDGFLKVGVFVGYSWLRDSLIIPHVLDRTQRASGCHCWHCPLEWSHRYHWP